MHWLSAGVSVFGWIWISGSTGLHFGLKQDTHKLYSFLTYILNCWPLFLFVFLSIEYKEVLLLYVKSMILS